MPTQSGIWNLKQVRDGIAGALYAQQPLINDITGDIDGAQTTLTISGVAFGLLQGTVRFTSGATIADVTVTPASDVSMTVNVPQAIYDLAVGSTVGIKFITGLGSQSNTFNKTITEFRADFLVVAGGGGASNGAGGAGGLIAYDSFLIVRSTNYTVTIGGGGPGGAATKGTNGSNSVFSTFTAIGGGSGGYQSTPLAVGEGGDGGSGGGEGFGRPAPNDFPAGTGTQPSQPGDSGTFGFGNDGSRGYSDQVSYTSGGGGGGAGGASPYKGNNNNGGNGGLAKEWPTGSGTYYAGGGGGGTVSAGTQGLGGGTSVTAQKGGGANGVGSGTSNSGTENTGGGGGGNNTNTVGGTGGSGVVIIKYPDTLTLSNPGGGLTSTTATAGGFKVTTFTAGTGNVSFA